MFKAGDLVRCIECFPPYLDPLNVYVVEEDQTKPAWLRILGLGDWRAERFAPLQPAPGYGFTPAVEAELKGHSAAKDTQVGGSHYTDMKIQPIEYILANNIQFPEGNVIKYVSRWRAKGGVKDLEKAVHHLTLLIEHELAQQAAENDKATQSISNSIARVNAMRPYVKSAV